VYAGGGDRGIKRVDIKDGYKKGEWGMEYLIKK